MNSRKMILLVVLAWVFLFIFIAVVLLSSSGWGNAQWVPVVGNTQTDSETQLNIWTVGMSTRVFDRLSDGFNKYYDTSIQVRSKNFWDYEDYIDVLPRVIQDGNSPDIFIVPNNGWFTTLNQYIRHMSEDMVDLKEFERQFHPHFQEQLVFEEKRLVSGTQQLVTGLKGMPVGFETLWIYYNNNILQWLPRTWDEVSERVRDPLKDDPISPIALGAWNSLNDSSDVLTALLAQRWDEAVGYENFSSIPARSVIDNYISYKREPNNLARFEEEFQSGLSTTDLFVRGNIASIIGYPSSLREIKIAIKRAKKDGVDSGDIDKFEKFLKWWHLPQQSLPEEGDDLINISRFHYLAMSKTAKHPRNALLFLNYLMTQEAQETFFKEHKYYLPARTDLLSKHAKSTIDVKWGTSKWEMKVSDFYTDRYRFITNDMGIPNLYRYIIPKALDEPGTVAEVVAGNVVKYLKCKVRQALEWDNYDVGCECQTEVEKTSGSYWPLCEAN